MLGLVAITINQNVLHCHIRLLLRSLNLLGRCTSDLAVLVLQTSRKTLNRNGVLLQLKALWQLVKAFRLDFLGVILTNEAISQRRIRYHNLGNNLFLTRLSHLLLRDLFNTIFLRRIRILVHRIALSIDLRNPLFDLNINRAGYGHLSGTSLGRGTRDFARLRINLQPRRQPLSSVFRLSPLSDVVRQIIEQWRNLISRVLVILRTQRQLLRHHSSERVCHLPTIRRLTRRRINNNHSCCKDRGLLQILRRLEITRRQHTLIVTLDDADRVLDLFLVTICISCVPTNRIIRIRDQTSSLGGHLRTRTTLIVIRVVLRNIKDRLSINQRELQRSHIRTREHITQILIVLEHVHGERRELNITTLNLRVDVHVVNVDVTGLRSIHITRQKRLVTGSAVIWVEVLRNSAEITIFKLVRNLRSEILLRTRTTIGTLKRQVDRAIRLRRHDDRLSNVRTYTVLILIRLNNAFLIRTLLLNRVAIVCVLPRVNLTRNLVIEVRRNNLYPASCTITLTRLIPVIPRQRTSILTRLPPHPRMRRRSATALNRAVATIIRELTINRRLTSLTIKRTRPLILRLSQPINLRRLFLQHKTTVGDAGTSRTSCKVPRLLNTTNTVGVPARLHIASHNHRILRFIRVLAPDTDLKVTITSQIPARCTNRGRHTLR